ncbi:peptidoglycan-binding protein [Shouchella clausii]|uniref:peptidoglycan-binding protein n=1 Tax=Shouchella clausii TaxID=79880 RepID=UPI000B97180E|nr:peptidoglycan-binding protein [Shouchella clausii]AST97853.1 peptidoglycan-binding protein [Shouchella clausii]MCM3549021.1 peptidoglycan-binding protein [Shouchella clausii]MEB5474130.1 peptidoglycan-binding protein [Shouchella clausii]QNM44295.1 peptidoglycan-binding protein [Shouchella clausii]WQG97014.1 peptidoglycan-binding protein [Shouchella clausii]
MKKQIPFKVFRSIGLPVVTAGVIFFSAPTMANAMSDRTLSQGDSGEQVEQLQLLLTDNGVFDKEDINGTFGNSTTSAIKEFQASEDLLVDGIAGLQTLGALHALEHGDEGKLVEELQEQLINLNYYKGEVDGLFGSLTERAVKSFQSDNGIEVDGIAGPATYSKLYYNQKSASAEPIKVEEKQAEPTQQSEEASEEPKANQNQEQPATVEEEPVEEPQAEPQAKAEPETQQESKKEEPAEESAPAKSEQPAEEAPKPAEDSKTTEGTATYQMEATAYSADCNGCSGVTATGIDLKANPNQKVIAVDPSVIPLGSRVYVEGYGEAIAGDTGGAISGNKIDVFVPSQSDAINFGRKTVKVTVLD